MNIKDIQTSFRRNIENKTLVAISGDPFFAEFKTGHIPLEKRMAVYQNNVWQRLVNVIKNNYPTVQIIVGDEFLHYMALEFIKNNFPRSGYLNDYGASFPEFVRRFEPARGMPYLYDMARIDVASDKAYNAPDDPILDQKQLKAVAPENYAAVKLTFHSSVSLIKSDYPIWRIYEMARSERKKQDDFIKEQITPNAAQDPDAQKIESRKVVDDEKAEQNNSNETAPDNDTQALDINSGGEQVIILRQGLKVGIYQLKECHLKFLVYLRNGHNLGEAAGKVMARYHSFDLAKTFGNELERETFSGFTLAE